MFNKLKYKINTTLIIFLLLLLIIESIISVISISDNVRDNFINFSEEKIELTIINSDFHLETIINFSNSISKTENFFENVKNGIYSLNRIPSVPQSIIGITIYDLNNNTYYSNNISNVPTLKALKTNDRINSFFESDEMSCFITRTTVIATFYSGLNYDPNYGVISHITKLFTENVLVGYMFVDVRPLYLYTNIFDISKNYDDAISFITCSDGYLKSTINSPYVSYLNEIRINETISSDDNLFYLISKPLKTIDSTLVILIPKRNYRLQVLKVIYPIFILDIIFGFIAINCSISISKKITKSLEILKEKTEEL